MTDKIKKIANELEYPISILVVHEGSLWLERFNQNVLNRIVVVIEVICLQCLDTVAWATGRAVYRACKKPTAAIPKAPGK